MLLLIACTGTKGADSGGDSEAAYVGGPQISIGSPSDGASVRGGFSVEGLAQDEESVAADLNVRIKPDPQGGSSFSNWQAVNSDGSWSFSLPAQTPGMVVVEVEAEDPAGNPGSDRITLAINDEDAPLLNIQVPSEGELLLEGSTLEMEVEISDDRPGPWELSWFLSDGASSPELGCDGSSDSPAPCSWSAVAGEWSLYVRAESSDALSGTATTHFRVATAEEFDNDGDGFSEEEGDCDDSDSSIVLGQVLVWEDWDGDGYGGEAVTLCVMEVGYATTDGDCNDLDATVYPVAPEYCDEEDNDCNGSIDDKPVNPSTTYPDGDGDGEGAGTGSVGCPTPGYSVSSTDCDDSDASIYTGAPEFCDEVDHDCDGLVNEGTSVDASKQYLDQDGDGYGDPGSWLGACDPMDGYSTDSSDCDDQKSSIYPGADEYCNQVDDDCDGVVDETDAVDARSFYLDGDGDGYGDATAFVTGCTLPSGYSYRDDDCDDGDATVNPAAIEGCDNLDQNCDGLADEDLATAWYLDADGDGFGDEKTVPTYNCLQPAGTVGGGGDCDDTNSSVYSTALEYCDGIDNNCDGTADDNPVDGSLWYRDADQDGYGDALVYDNACSQPAGYVADDTDCDDRTSDRNPGELELCDNKDNDCDGTVDETASGSVTYYLDGDGDGYGLSSSTLSSCSVPIGYAGMFGDCDDSDRSINPGAAESCDGIDNDCDGQIDPSNSNNATVWYRDQDGDNYGGAGSQSACLAPAGYVSPPGDCNDQDSNIYPGAAEYCDGQDHDCDGARNESDSVDAGVWYADWDRDGFGDANSYQVSCSQPAASTGDSQDCDDNDLKINPNASESCDLIDVDEDCDGLSEDDDPSVNNQVSYYRDGDGDGYGDSSQTMLSCETPAGYVVTGGDCDDADAAKSPGEAEICDGLDNDCDGVVNGAMMDGYEPNESGAGAYVLNGAVNVTNTSLTFDVTLHLSSDQDWFYWSTLDPVGGSASAQTNLTLTVNNPSFTPMTLVIYDLNHSTDSASVTSSAASFSLVAPTSLNQYNETRWKMSVVPDNAGGWGLSHCNDAISITIREY